MQQYRNYWVRTLEHLEHLALNQPAGALIISKLAASKCIENNEAVDILLYPVVPLKYFFFTFIMCLISYALCFENFYFMQRIVYYCRLTKIEIFLRLRNILIIAESGIIIKNFYNVWHTLFFHHFYY